MHPCKTLCAVRYTSAKTAVRLPSVVHHAPPEDFGFGLPESPGLSPARDDDLPEAGEGISRDSSNEFEARTVPHKKEAKRSWSAICRAGNDKPVP